jgi:hypothetical protein
MELAGFSIPLTDLEVAQIRRELRCLRQRIREEMGATEAAAIRARADFLGFIVEQSLKRTYANNRKQFRELTTKELQFNLVEDKL